MLEMLEGGSVLTDSSKDAPRSHPLLPYLPLSILPVTEPLRATHEWQGNATHLHLLS